MSMMPPPTMPPPEMDPAMMDPALGGGPVEGDPAAVLSQPAPDPELGPSYLASLADPAAARSNPNKDWQSTAPTLPVTIYSLEPSDEERRKVQRCLELFNQAREHRAPLRKSWTRNYRFLKNRTTGKKPSRPDWLPAPEVPEIFPIAATISGWMSDQRPTSTVAPMSLPHDSFAQLLTGMAEDLEFTMEASYQANDEERQVKLATWDSVVYGTAIFKTYWDPWKAGGIGDATFDRVSPYNFYPDPLATDTSDGSYYIEARRMALDELDRRYPGTFELFRDGSTGGESTIDEPPSALGSDSNRQGPTPGALSPSTSPNTSRASNHGGIRPGDNVLDRTVTVLECWVREHEIVDVVDMRTGETTPRASDEWRLLVIANNRLILEAHAHDLWDHGRHPYDRFPFFEVNGEFWSPAPVELLIDSQRAINRILAALQHNTELTGNPIMKEPKTNSRTPLNNRPGQRISVDKNRGEDVGWLDPPTINPAYIQLLEYHLKRMESISGMNAVVKGATPSGRSSEGVVDSVQEAAFVRIRDALRNMEWALKGVFRKKADLICSNYSTPRMVAIAGPRAERSSIALKSGHFLIPTSTGRIPFVYQLNVDAGARSHTSRSMREDRAVQLFTLGAIDEEALLVDVEYPNAKAVADRVVQKRAAAMTEEPGKRERARA